VGRILIEKLEQLTWRTEEKGQKCERASHLSWGLAYDDVAWPFFSKNGRFFGLLFKKTVGLKQVSQV